MMRPDKGRKLIDKANLKPASTSQLTLERTFSLPSESIYPACNHASPPAYWYQISTSYTPAEIYSSFPSSYAFFLVIRSTFGKVFRNYWPLTCIYAPCLDLMPNVYLPDFSKSTLPVKIATKLSRSYTSFAKPDLPQPKKYSSGTLSSNNGLLNISLLITIFSAYST